MHASVLSLPRVLRTRDQARSLVRGSVRTGTDTVAIGAFTSKVVTAGAADEIVKQLMEVGAERVVVVSASDALKRSLKTAHDRRATPETTFLMQFQSKDPEVLLRTV